MRDTRLHIEAPLGAGANLDLGPEATHYLRAVLRARAGQTLRVFNADSGEWRARLVRLDRHRGTIAIEAQLRAPIPEPGPTLLFAPLKKPRLEWLLEKAVELGVARLQPVRCRHAVVEATKPDRLRQRLVEAAEQCERLSLPKLLPETDLLEAVQAAHLDGVIFADEAGGAGLAPILCRFPEAALLVGPEGGFASEERAALRAQEFVRPVSLGPTILRAETASLMLLACHRALTGAADQSRQAEAYADFATSCH
ncbi:MAG: 16S rRNA (uracil(1498)-N(3))-methyltransferase [Geminicoccaceae bacterium]